MIMKRDIAVGIDIGTHHIKVVVAEPSKKPGNLPRILGVGSAPSKGLRNGYIIHQTDAVRSIRKAIREAQKSSGIQISRVFLSIGGIGLSSYSSTGSVMISRADSEITDLDIEKVIDESQAQIPTSISMNRKVIHTIPVAYKTDGNTVLGDPVGTKAVNLEVETLFVMCLEHHLSELIQAVEDAGVEIIDVMASPLAASLVSLSKSEKIAGCVLVNIGSETVSMVVYENDIPISLEVLPIGSNDITNDIALGLKISLEEAEKVKREIGSGRNPDHPKKKLEEIVSARLSDIFELIEAHLKKIGKSGLLPAGIIMTGGGSGVTTIEDLAKANLNLPSRVTGLACDSSKVECVDNNMVKVKDSTWAVAYGLCMFGLHSEGDGPIRSKVGAKILKNTGGAFIQWIKRFLP